MKCLTPKTISDPRYPKEGVYMSVPCGKCVACKKKYIQDWTTRLIDESKTNGRHYFLTLTYAVEPKTYQKRDIQLFLKKLRNYGKSIKLRYFVVGERGEQHNRVHYHAILFTDSMFDLTPEISRAWTHGFIKAGTVTPKSCAYVCKYIVPVGDDDKFVLMSRRSGIGSQRLTDTFIKSYQESPRHYTYQNGYRKGLPRYYKKKLADHAVVFPRLSDDQSELQRIADYEREFGQYDTSQFFKGEKTYRQQQIEHLENEFNRSDKRGRK